MAVEDVFIYSLNLNLSRGYLEHIFTSPAWSFTSPGLVD